MPAGPVRSNKGWNLLYPNESKLRPVWVGVCLYCDDWQKTTERGKNCLDCGDSYNYKYLLSRSDWNRFNDSHESTLITSDMRWLSKYALKKIKIK